MVDTILQFSTQVTIGQMEKGWGDEGDAEKEGWGVWLSHKFSGFILMQLDQLFITTWALALGQEHDRERHMHGGMFTFLG